MRNLSPKYSDLQASVEEKKESLADSYKEEVPINQQDRSYHADFVRKKQIRIKVRMLDGSCCIGNCHVFWPDGRTSDVINDDRKFMILTDATVEGEHHKYNILTINKERVEMIFELHKSNNADSYPPSKAMPQPR